MVARLAVAVVATVFLNLVSGRLDLIYAASDSEPPLALVAIRPFSVHAEKGAEVPGELGLELAQALAAQLRDRRFDAQVIQKNESPPQATRYTVTGEIEASGGSLKGRLYSLGLVGRAKVKASAKLYDNRSGRVLEEFEDSASTGKWSGASGSLEACAKQVGESLGSKIAKRSSAALTAKPAESTADAAPAKAAATKQQAAVTKRAPGNGAAPHRSGVAARVTPILVGTWHSGSGTTLKFDGAGTVEETTDASHRSGRYEILDAEQIVLTFDAQAKEANSGTKAGSNRNSSYLVKYRINGDDLTLIYLDAEVWKYRKQR